MTPLFRPLFQLPYVMNELTLTELDMGFSIPKILRASKPWVDHRGRRRNDNKNVMFFTDFSVLLQILISNHMLIVLVFAVHLSGLGFCPVSSAVLSCLRGLQ